MKLEHFSNNLRELSASESAEINGGESESYWAGVFFGCFIADMKDIYNHIIRR